MNKTRWMIGLLVAAVLAHRAALPERALELAVQAGVKNLILTHVSRRYREREILEEAQKIFPATLVARDFDHYKVTREEETQEK